ncbi:Hyalin [Holothuria leucospilota]|uniref:Hyalin n=1 Tax=Holothuria leucospilota TaxID=206669 RepID=A0A9Q1H6W1_HOLLE|nr:Hyalin [Holothuria leucospilota]
MKTTINCILTIWEHFTGLHCWNVTSPVNVDCPSDSGGIEASLPSTSNHAIVSWRDPVATDNSAGGVNVTLSGGENGGVFYPGNTEVTYNVMDSSGNLNYCIFNVTVVEHSQGNMESTISFDNYRDVVTIVQSGGNIDNMFPLGVTNITNTLYDTSENYNQCNFAVIVRDVTEPVITNCPVIIFTSTCGKKEKVSWLEPTATDNSKRSVQIKASEKPGDTFTVGNHSAIYTFEDESGNTALCTFVVLVEKKTECVRHASYIAFIALGFYLLLVCLAIALCAFLLYRRKRNSSQYIISPHYDTILESGQPHSNFIELNSYRPTGRTVVDDPWTCEGSIAMGGMDPDLCKAGYVNLEKSEKFYDS